MPKMTTAKGSGAQFCIDESKPKMKYVGILERGLYDHWEVVVGRKSPYNESDQREWINVYNFKKGFRPQKGLTVSFTLVHAYYLGFAGSSPIELAFDVKKSK
jgi:hypothetical protein